jgi:hypothetical protein
MSQGAAIEIVRARKANGGTREEEGCRRAIRRTLREEERAFAWRSVRSGRRRDHLLLCETFREEERRSRI